MYSLWDLFQAHFDKSPWIQNEQEILSLRNAEEDNGEHSNTKKYRPIIPMKLKVLRATVYVLYNSMNLGYVPLFIFRLFQKSRKCSKITDDLLRIPANELVTKIMKREVSCEEIIRSYISRIEEVNPLLNAVIEARYSEAIEDAKAVDRLVCSEEFLNNRHKYAEQYPLLGVPVTVKGSIAVKDLPLTAGMVSRKNLRAKVDATIVKLARKAGAIPLLVSNVPELCMNLDCTNKLKGFTRNPHDTSKTSGGSSGGEASLLGAGASLVGIGSDLAGSIRIPAHFCGVYGHKPSAGVVSNEGHFPSCPHKEEWDSILTLGPMARYAKDLKTLLGVIAKPEEREKLQLNKMIDMKNIKIYFMEMKDFYWQSTNYNCIDAVQKTVGHFSRVCDTPPRKADIPLFQYAADLSVLKVLGIDDVDFILDGGRRNLCTEALRYATFRSDHCFVTLCYGILHKLLKTALSDKDIQQVDESILKLRRGFENTLGQDGVLIMPTAPFEAFSHGDGPRRIFPGVGFTAIFNLLGFPVTNCPVSVTDKGLPLGVQIIGLPYSDNLTLAVAEEIEKSLGGWIEP